jgi:hypothetical protein
LLGWSHRLEGEMKLVKFFELVLAVVMAMGVLLLVCLVLVILKMTCVYVFS